MKEVIETKKAYNKLAKEYHELRIKGKKFHNEYLEMPTTLKLLGKVKGKKILDLGCGTGVYAKILTGKGAWVKGIDISEKEIKIARKENPEIDFKVGNAEKLLYKNKEFDIVIAALVLEHFKNWNKVLKEIYRVLREKGLFIFSIGNPVVNCIRNRDGKNVEIIRNYFKEQKIKGFWWNNIYINWYHKPYGKIVKLLVNKGFELVGYEDSKPIKKAEKLFPKEYTFTSILPYFCTWKWRKR